MGRIFLKSGDYIVDEITTPKNSDRQSRYTFFRSKSHHDIALKSWQDSDGQCLYLGLWHSHPESNPIPSKVDYSDWKNALKKGQYEGHSLLFLIMGMTNLGCWQGVYRKGRAPRFYPLERAD
ncbi:MAG: Mov34/MPN/PAD-1 family protein [Arenicella sp.]|nr:Mov34/MPN/PAD-1 family protein [Arenicella sp.]